jgi:hypothetical protein
VHRQVDVSSVLALYANDISASSSLPFFCRTAPVKAPCSWPNSSLSSSVSGIAARLMAMNGRVHRVLDNATTAAFRQIH